jgi:LysM repeat protein
LHREAGTRLTINTTLRRLYHYRGGELVKVYPVAVGKPSTPTPTGDYKIITKILNPGGVLGTRWMGLSIPGGNYGIHGTNNPSSIGTAVSLGCIRMHNHNVEELFPQVNIGTPVHITRVTRDPQDTKPSTDKSPSPGDTVYTVQPGDTLWEISQKYNLTPEELAAFNNIENPDIIYPGQELIIPGR